VVARRSLPVSRWGPPRVALSIAFVGAAMAFGLPARADVNFLWDAPPSCPQRDEVLARIRSLAGSALEQTAGLSMQGTIAPARGRYWLTLLVGEGRETRRRVIASDSCADLAGAAAITVALLLGVDASAVETAPPAAPAPKPAPPMEKLPPSDESSATLETSDAPAPLRSWRGVVRAPIGAADVGPLPRAGFGVGLGAGVRHASWRILALGRVARRQTVNDSDAAGEFGVELERITVELLTCRGWRSLRFEIAPCLGVALEHLDARGFGDGVAAASERAAWPALSAGGAAHWYATESLGFFLGMTGYVELSRPRLVIEGLGQLAQLAPLALGATFGVEWIL